MLDAGAAVLAVSGIKGGATPPGSGSGADSGGGGGGAVTSLDWLLGIAAAALALHRTQRAQRVHILGVSQHHDRRSL